MGSDHLEGINLLLLLLLVEGVAITTPRHELILPRADFSTRRNKNMEIDETKSSLPSHRPASRSLVWTCTRTTKSAPVALIIFILEKGVQK